MAWTTQEKLSFATYQIKGQDGKTTVALIASLSKQSIERILLLINNKFGRGVKKPNQIKIEELMSAAMAEAKHSISYTI